MAQKILIVDDDRINTAIIKFSLSERGYDVSFADDGDKGILKVQKETPDLIVLDVQMPNMNGFEFVNELKSFQGMDMTPVIMLTANETMEEMFKLEGVKAYFVKPIDPPKLIEKIIEILGPNPRG